MTNPTAPPDLTIGAMVHAARTSAGLSFRQLSKLAGVPQVKIHEIEKHNMAYPALLDRLIPALGLDRDAAYAAAGRVPPELAAGLAADLPLMRRVRKELDL